MINLRKKNYPKLLFILSFLILTSAFIIEYVFGYQPCNLCLIERIPYGFSIIILLLNFLFKKDQVFYSVLLMLIFSFSTIISIYHLGIEQGLLLESSICTSQNLDLITKEQVLNSFKELNISCKNVAFKIFGLSLTTYNIFASILMLILSAKIYLLSKNYGNKK
jgi:disulfide bond formation protein DsbB